MLFGLMDQVEKNSIPVHEHQYVSQLLVEDGLCLILSWRLTLLLS